MTHLEKLCTGDGPLPKNLRFASPDEDHETVLGDIIFALCECACSLQGQLDMTTQQLLQQRCAESTRLNKLEDRIQEMSESLSKLDAQKPEMITGHSDKKSSSAGRFPPQPAVVDYVFASRCLFSCWMSSAGPAFRAIGDFVHASATMVICNLSHNRVLSLHAVILVRSAKGEVSKASNIPLASF